MPESDTAHPAGPAPADAAPQSGHVSGHGAGQGAGRGRLTAVALSLALAGLVGFLYAPVTEFGFVSLDDPYYIQQNPYVQDGLTWDHVGWAFTHARMRNWHPLAWVSHMVDVELFGMDAGGHHLTNALLQAAIVVLLLWVLRAYTGSLWRSAAVVALFAAHPLRVESVAWVTERKDLLAAFFFLWTLLAWVRYARAPSGTRYGWVLVAFTVTLLCKSTPITLPALLLLLDVWPLRRVEARWASAGPEETPAVSCPRRSVLALLIEKLPLVALSIGSAAMTLWAAGVSATTSKSIPMLNKLATPAIGYTEYLRKTVWPDDLACFYPLPQGYPDGVLDHWVQRGAVLYGVLGLLTIGILVASFGKRRKTYLAVGWFWYLGMLVPASGYVQVGSQLMADRYSYLPHIGLGIAVVWSVADLLGRSRVGRVVCGVALLGAVTALSVATRPQVETWRNSFRLYDHALRVTDDNYWAHQSLGVVLARRGDAQAAIEHQREALRINPTFVPAYLSLAEVLVAAAGGTAEAAEADGGDGGDGGGGTAEATGGDAGRLEAEQLLRTAARIDRDSFDARFDLGRLLSDDGRPGPAMEQLRQALELRPGSLECAALLGRLETESGDLAAGIELLKSVLERWPEHEPSRAALREARRLRRDG